MRLNAPSSRRYCISFLSTIDTIWSGIRVLRRARPFGVRQSFIVLPMGPL